MVKTAISRDLKRKIGSARESRRSQKSSAVALSEGAMQPASSIDLGAMRESVSFQLRYASWAVHAAFAKHFSPADAVPRQYSVLYLVSINPGISLKALAAAIGVDQSTLVPTIDVCEERGWIRRRRSKPDRRITALELTKEGNTTLQDLSEELDAHEALVSAGLSENDLRQLLITLRKIRSNALSERSAVPADSVASEK